MDEELPNASLSPPGRVLTTTFTHSGTPIPVTWTSTLATASASTAALKPASSNFTRPDTKPSDNSTVTTDEPPGNSTAAVAGDSSESQGAPVGAIAGGVVSPQCLCAPLTSQVGGVLGLAVLLALLFLFLRRRRRPQRVGRNLEK